MSLKSWWRQHLRKPKKQKPGAKPEAVSKENLREFVYLDEVSLRSLLSSLKGDLRDGSSEDLGNTSEAEALISVEAGNPVVGKAGGSSRFQTSNSSSIQTSRKATVQSWFRDFRAIQDIRLVEISKPNKAAASIETLKHTTDSSLLVASQDLVRGELVEFRVKLSADPVYHLSTVTSEFAGMADDYPEMFQAEGGLGLLHQAAPVRKILERLLAGLVPIRAVAIDYRVIELDGAEYVVHKNLIENLDLDSRPLQIVGVTELLAYWKDLRRVIFSEADFTILARISRTGVQTSWTPVKLADLFREMVPDLVKQINAAGRMPFTPQANKLSPASVKMGEALSYYASQVLELSGKSLDIGNKNKLATLIAELQLRSGSASDQYSAFNTLQVWLNDITGSVTSSDSRLELRGKAREDSGLSLFPSLETILPPTHDDKEEDQERLLDVEIISIYW